MNLSNLCKLVVESRCNLCSEFSHLNVKSGGSHPRLDVLKMLAVMEASQAAACPSAPAANGTTPPTPEEEGRPQDFLQSGRTGRRNALANILGEHAVVTSSDLPTQLEALTTKDKPEEKSAEAGSSKS